MTRNDYIKTVLAGFLVVAGVVAYYAVGIPKLGAWAFSTVILGLALGAVVFLNSAPGAEFVVFARESVKEAKKVVWPTRKEAMQVTGIVFVFVTLLGLLLWVVDWGVASLLNHILQWGS